MNNSACNAKLVYPKFKPGIFVTTQWINGLKAKLIEEGVNQFAFSNWSPQVMDDFLTLSPADYRNAKANALNPDFQRSFVRGNRAKKPYPWDIFDENGAVIIKDTRKNLDPCAAELMFKTFPDTVRESLLMRSFFTPLMKPTQIEDILNQIRAGMIQARFYVPVIVTCCIPIEYWSEFENVHTVCDTLNVIKGIKSFVDEWTMVHEIFTCGSDFVDRENSYSEPLSYSSQEDDIKHTSIEIQKLFQGIKNLNSLSIAQIQHYMLSQLVMSMHRRVSEHCYLEDSQFDPTSILTLSSSRILNPTAAITLVDDIISNLDPDSGAQPPLKKPRVSEEKDEDDIQQLSSRFEGPRAS